MLSHFAIAKFHLRLKASGRINLPAYKGSTFRGGFGQALRSMSPSWYSYFFEPSKAFSDPGSYSCRIPNPYVLLPPLDTERTYLKGHEFSCELTLFGQAARHYSICLAALEFLGRGLGIGHGKGKFKLVGLDAALPGENSSLGADYTISGDDIAGAAVSTSGKTATLRLVTRLRLKDQNRLVGRAPGFSVFFGRLMERLNAISRYYCGCEAVDRNEWQRLSRLARGIRVKEAKVRWDDWSRFSGRQRSWMRFGGLLGTVTYEGDLAPFLPYLALGEWCHVGGKTSFGLGKYVMER